jgi:hypothetical protein
VVVVGAGGEVGDFAVDMSYRYGDLGREILCGVLSGRRAPDFVLGGYGAGFAGESEDGGHRHSLSRDVGWGAEVSALADAKREEHAGRRFRVGFMRDFSGQWRERAFAG